MLARESRAGKRKMRLRSVAPSLSSRSREAGAECELCLRPNAQHHRVMDGLPERDLVSGVTGCKVQLLPLDNVSGESSLV